MQGAPVEHVSFHVAVSDFNVRGLCTGTDPTMVTRRRPHAQHLGFRALGKVEFGSPYAVPFGAASLRNLFAGETCTACAEGVRHVVSYQGNLY